MSLLHAVQEAIKSCRTEQTRINGRIQLYREILQTLSHNIEESESADDSATGTDTSPGEKEDIELLERALKKALHVRTGKKLSKKDKDKQSVPPKAPGTSVVTSKDRIHAPADKDSQNTAKFNRKEHKRPGVSVTSTLGSKSVVYNPGQCKTTVIRNIFPSCLASSSGILYHQAARKSQQSISTPDCLDLDQLHVSTFHAKRKTMRRDDLGKATASSVPSSNSTTPVLHTRESGAHHLHQQNRNVFAQTSKWKSLLIKQNRLWDKVAALQRNPVPERNHFMERIRDMFPKDWPCGSPDQTRALVNSLTNQGHDLTKRFQAKEIPAKQSSESDTLLGCEPLELLQMRAAELRKFTGQVKQEWDTWDQWRPEGGCLCPSGPNIVWGDGMVAPLPPTITYTMEADLRELENLRMRVALLQQEVCLEEALFDTLSPQLSSIVPGPECPDVSMLRDVYSLLGEGGQRFPAIVLDS
ncbi:tubulin epsilon and delta complex protein 2 [Antennarius striatus]|uniref:tubulin epsilon and delta complex protein 2 n=1 Tax=Antennarius striatus TaxID=241820 RepID=UPI0035AE1626